MLMGSYMPLAEGDGSQGVLGFEQLGEVECKNHFQFGCIHVTVLSSG